MTANTASITLHPIGHPDQTFEVYNAAEYERLWKGSITSDGPIEHKFFKVHYAEVRTPDPLPTEPGTPIRATIRGVPDVLAFLGDDGDWFTSTTVLGAWFHEPDLIDLSTVRAGRVVFDD